MLELGHEIGNNSLSDGKRSDINDLATEFLMERSHPESIKAAWSAARWDYCYGSRYWLPPMNSQDYSR